MGIETYEADNLVVGTNTSTDNRLVLTSGQNLVRGRLLTVTLGKLVGADTGDTPHSILVHDVDASGGDLPCAYYTEGKFNEDAIDYGTGDEDEFREALRSVQILTVSGV